MKEHISSLFNIAPEPPIARILTLLNTHSNHQADRTQATAGFFSMSTWLTRHLSSTEHPTLSCWAVLLAALGTCTWRKRKEEKT